MSGPGARTCPLKLSWAAAADADGRLVVAGGAFWPPPVTDVPNTDRVFLMRRRGSQPAGSIPSLNLHPHLHVLMRGRF